MIKEIQAPKWLDEFKSFIARGNVVDLAVGIIIGAAFTTIVNSLVTDLLTPVLGLLIGGLDFSNYFIALKGPHLATLKASKDAGAVTLNYGVFLNAVINFLIVSAAIFMLVKQVQRLRRAEEKKPAAPPAPTPTESLLAEIRDLLKANEPERASLAPVQSQAGRR